MQLYEYARYDGIGLAELIRRKATTARELFELALHAIAATHAELNAVVESFTDRIPSQDFVPAAQEPFGGVPLLLKDFPIERGTLAQMGSELAVGFRSEQDIVVMERFRNAGFISLGRTATSEFGLAAATISRLTGITRNPWDTTRSTAGSSGGSAAAVAAGIVPVANAGDGGGSIRNPASFCGLVGLKPTRGRITAAPYNGHSYSGMVVNFALTRTIRDCAAALDAVAGPSAGDPYVIAPPERPYREELQRACKRPLRIAFTDVAWSGLPVAPELVQGVHATAHLLEQLGHVVIEDAPKFDYGAYLAAQIDLWAAHTAAFIDDVADAMGRAPSPQNMQTTMWAAYSAGKLLSATRLLKAEDTYARIMRDVGQFFASYDVLLTPTNTIAAPLLTTIDLDAPGATLRDVFDHLEPIETFTALFNATGQPALSLPLHWTAAGLPIGMQFVGRFGDEATLLQLAARLEEARPWSQRLPAVHVSRAAGGQSTDRASGSPQTAGQPTQAA